MTRLCVILLVCVLYVSGCIKSDEVKEEGFKCSDGRIVSEPILCINERTTTRQATTIPETSTSTRPPTFFPTTTSTTTVKQIIPVYRTTTLTDPCANGMLDGEEEIPDCGGECYCRILRLDVGGMKKTHEPSGYVFSWNNTIHVKEGECGSSRWPVRASYFHKECSHMKYVLNVTTPESLKDLRYVTGGNTYFIDWLEFGILEENESFLDIAVRKDPETLNITSQYRIMSIGGECGVRKSELCQREYRGYKLRLIERETQKIKLEVTAPDGDIIPNVWVEKTPTRIRDLEIGVIRPITLGGYSTIYLR
jgi:hypothetical protein